MGASIGGNFGNTIGSSKSNSAGNNVRLPTNSSQIKHIFADREGHLSYTRENKKKIIRVANDDKNYSGTDKYGNRWYSKTMRDGRQIWVKVHKDIISDAGVNKAPRSWDNETGFNVNPKKNNTWRKKR